MKIKLFGNVSVTEYEKNIMQMVGLDIQSVNLPYDEYDFIYPAFNIEILMPMGSTVKFQNIVSLLNKKTSADMITACGLNTLDTFDATENNLTEYFNNRPFILKPKIGSGSSAVRNHLEYKIFNDKQDFISNIPEGLDFFATHEGRYIFQESVRRIDGSTKQLYCSGYVGLDGTIFHEGISTQIWKDNTSDSSEDVNRTGTPNFVNLNTLRDASDKTDILNFVGQIQTLIDSYQIKSIPFHIQALVSHDDTECFISDISFNFSSAIINYKTDSDGEYLKDKMNFMYNGTPISIQNNYWYSYQHFIPDVGIITQEQVEYGKTIGIVSCFKPNDGWGKKAIPFSIRGTSESDVLNKIQQFKTYIGMS